MPELAKDLNRFAETIEHRLDQFLSEASLSGPGPAAERLVAAMRHGTLGGGKRLRPYLVVQTAAMFDIPERSALDAALSVELVHCYSLIHDDLPAMDDDDLRRGRPTVHKAFDEATAILAGDALLTHAFGLLAAPETHPDPTIRTMLVAELVRGAGAGGMAGGQMRDLDGEGTTPAPDAIATMQKMKTGALIRAAVRMGALLGRASTDELLALNIYGENIGRAFQLADDILDLTASADAMGKATGKDAARQKPTLVSQIGLDAAQRHLGDTVHHALSSLSLFGRKADILRQIAIFIAEREK